MKKILLGLLVTLFMASCNSSKNVNYMQDVVLDSTVIVNNAKKITVRPGDVLSIVVTCKEPQLSAMFNQLVTRQALSNTIGGSKGGGRSTIGGGTQGETVPYTVDDNGNIDFPILGELHVAGLDRAQIARLVKGKIIEGKYIDNPQVSVTFADLHYSVIGEVKSPGIYYITNDHVTLLDALAQAGDLTIYGKRDAVYVTRTVDGKRTTSKVDLTRSDFYDSPIFYLQQGDVVYVEPNNTRAGQSSINENSLKSVGMWMSIASFAMSLAVLIFK